MKDKLKELYEEYAPKVKEFVLITARDFKMCWTIYPNVLIWCGIAGIILLLI
jgi:hypothetical protein